MAKTFESMEEHMLAPSGNNTFAGGPSSRVNELGIVLPAPPTPLGAYVESSDTGNLLFLSGMLPVVNRKLAISGRLGEKLSVKEGQEAARLASLNALAAAKHHLGDLDRLRKLVKLTVLMATTEQFTDHAQVSDGASNLFVQIFGPEEGHVRLVYGVQSLPIGAPVIVDVIFEIEPQPQSTAKSAQHYPARFRRAKATEQKNETEQKPEITMNTIETYKETNVMEIGLTASQRVAICFAAGVVGAVAVVVFSYVLFGLGLSAALGVKAPIPLKSPDIYRPLFWGGLWGIPFGLLIKPAWVRLYLVGLLYFLAPMLALFLIFLPMSGAGYFGLRQGPTFTLYLLLVNLPFGIVMALAARAMIGKNP